jgi:macrodomain Ter protein organizer (MatP/YcbG family)
MILGASLLPSLSVYIRQANYEKLRKTAEKNGKTIGQTINELIEEKL